MDSDADMVMRSIYLAPSQDGRLRQLAHELNVTKSELIRAAIAIKLDEWTAEGGVRVILADLERARREPKTERPRLDRSRSRRSSPS